MKAYKKRHQDDPEYWIHHYEMIAAKIQKVMRLNQSLIKRMNKGILESEKTVLHAIAELDQEVERAERESHVLGENARIQEFQQTIERRKELYGTYEYLKKLGDIVRTEIEATGG